MSRPTTKDRILHLLRIVNHPLIASDIAHPLKITTRQASSHLRQLVADGHVNAQYPHKHLGDRFPTSYWINPVQGRDNDGQS